MAVLISQQSRSDLLACRNAREQDRADYTDLLNRYHELRGHGAIAGGLKPEPEPSAPSDIAITEVVDRFGGNVRLRRKLLQFQASARRENADEADIARSILEWKDPNETDD